MKPLDLTELTVTEDYPLIQPGFKCFTCKLQVTAQSRYTFDRYLPELRPMLEKEARLGVWHHLYGAFTSPIHELIYLGDMWIDSLHTPEIDRQRYFEIRHRLLALLAPKT